MINLFNEVENQLLKKEWGKGLTNYSQSHCKVTLTDDGYRIYRTPNLIYSEDGSVMWGGLKLRPYDQNGQDVLQKGHTYVVKFHIKGKSSNAPQQLGWSNNMGWNGGGLIPSPSNIEHNAFKVNFEGEYEYYYKFTINDEVYKVCTKSYSSFVEGQTYLSYKDFQFGFGYMNTGEMGTDIYITNIRMYDITDEVSPIDFHIIGNAIIGDASELANSDLGLNNYGSLYANKIAEY